MNVPQPQTSHVHPKHAKEKLGHGFEEQVKFVNPGVSQGRKQGRWFSRRWAGVVCANLSPSGPSPGSHLPLQARRQSLATEFTILGTMSFPVVS